MVYQIYLVLSVIYVALIVGVLIADLFLHRDCRKALEKLEYDRHVLSMQFTTNHKEIEELKRELKSWQNQTEKR